MQQAQRCHQPGGWAHLVLPVLQNLFICFQVLLNSLFELDAVDLDPEEISREVGIEGEDVIVLDFPSLDPRQHLKAIISVKQNPSLRTATLFTEKP